MRNSLNTIFIICSLLIFTLPLTAQISEGYQIATWKDFKEAAVTYTWDDNSANHLTVAQPLFDKYDFNTTFFVTTNFSPDWEGFQAAADMGHEVASHSMNHYDYTQMTEADRRHELEGSKSAINSKISGGQCLTFAYPYCNVGADNETDDYYLSARTCQGYIEKSTPDNMMQVSSIVCGSQGPVKTSIDFNNKVEEATPTKGWLVFLLHGIDNEQAFSPVDSGEFDAHLNYMDQNRDRLWVSTYSETVRYISERDHSNLTEIVFDDKEIVFQLTHQMDPNIFNLPITIKRKLPMAWEDVKVEQSNQLVNHQIIVDADTSYIVFDAIPNYGNVVISNQTVPNSNQDVSVIQNLKMFPNPVSSLLNIEFYLESSAEVKIEIKNVLGQKLLGQKLGVLGSGKQSSSIALNSIQENMVLVEVHIGEMVYYEKIILKKE